MLFSKNGLLTIISLSLSRFLFFFFFFSFLLTKTDFYKQSVLQFCISNFLNVYHPSPPPLALLVSEICVIQLLDVRESSHWFQLFGLQ